MNIADINLMSWFIFIVLIIIILVSAFFYKNIWEKHSNFNNIAIGACAILTLTWGAYTFDALNQKEKASIELQEIQKRIKNTESTFFSIEVNEARDCNGIYILPVITIRNNGTEPIHIGLDKESMTIQRVRVDNEKIIALSTYHPNFYEILSDDKNIKHTPMYDLIIPISAERKISYALRVKDPGLYYLTFRAKTIGENGDEEVKEKNGKPIIWFTSKYLYVKE
ncbi:hypothetical protein [Proteus sp. TJ1640]|uniref:hypothetical protein n=1 Tax=Proteus sp. TJ1640 TaxID=2050968 RepID=UPI000D69AC31|nr:hypothetical protein [Proteus sp. TJ1640]